MSQMISTDEIVATNVTFEEYLQKYAADFHEFVKGTVIKMPPVHERHDQLTRYGAMLLESYFDRRPIGKIRQGPFVMQISAHNISREPDIQIILEANYSHLQPTYMDGPADICIEVVSLESVKRDHGEKFEEYELGGVKEYWIIDPLRDETRFYRLNAEGRYIGIREDAQGYYQTPLLPGFKLHVPTLWDEPLPGYGAIWESTKALLG
jgi:Uma2 family endonuclease